MKNIKQLLELNIEIEGLLRVAEHRKSTTVESMLQAKSEKFLDLLIISIDEDESLQKAIFEIPSELNPQEEDTKSENAASQGSPITDSEEEVKESNSAIVEITEVAHEVIPEVAADAMSEEADAMSEEIETVLEMDLHEQITQLPQPSCIQTPPTFKTPPTLTGTSTLKDTEEQMPVKDQNEIFPHKELSAEPNHVMRLDEMIHRQSSRDLKKSFSLNDRFRYIREIFDNDANYFDETIRNLDLLSNLDEVYDYLLGDIGLNHEDETVKEFLAIIYNHFNA